MKTVFTRENIEVIEVTPNIFFRKSNIEGNNQCDGAYIVSGGTVCAVEAPSVEGMAEMAEEAQILFGKPIRYYFLTHNDWDHTDGLPALYDQPAAIFCSKNMVDMFAPKDKPCKATFIGVQGTLKLRLEGYDVELTTLEGGAHNPDDMVVYMPSDKCLCTGDMCVDYKHLYFHKANVPNWIAHLGKLYRDDGRYLLTGHRDIHPYGFLLDVRDFIVVLKRSAEVCIGRIRNAGLEATDETVEKAVLEFLKNGGADAAEILGKTEAEAPRELGMMAKSLLGLPMSVN